MLVSESDEEGKTSLQEEPHDEKAVGICQMLFNLEFVYKSLSYDQFFYGTYRYFF